MGWDGSEGAAGKNEIRLRANCEAVNGWKRRGRGKRKSPTFFRRNFLPLDSTRKECEFFKAMLSFTLYGGCVSVAFPSPPVVLSPRINYRVSVTADGSPTLPCSHRCILGKRQVQPKVVFFVCVCV